VKHIPRRSLAIIVALAIAASLATTAHAQSTGEASRLRILLVLDTDDKQGDTWGLDGENMRAFLEAALKKQKLESRFTIDHFTGKDVTADRVLKYYESLDVRTDEALLFYYSGHGGYNLTRGHFMAFTRGPLYRKELLAAMSKHNPRLVVVLTDCCANIAGGAEAVEPPGAKEEAIEGNGTHTRRAKISEPPAQVRALGGRPFAPTITKLDKKLATKEEPPGAAIAAIKQTQPPPALKAKREEPRGSTQTFSISLQTGDGPVPLQQLIDKSDGVVLRHLLFRQSGIVDISGCQKGKLSHGATPWGGSLFTIAFLSLQKEKTAFFDKNGNNVVEWDEFFPSLRDCTEKAGKRQRGTIQVPELWELSRPK
jgi:hypothetical protein